MYDAERAQTDGCTRRGFLTVLGTCAGIAGIGACAAPLRAQASTPAAAGAAAPAGSSATSDAGAPSNSVWNQSPDELYAGIPCMGDVTYPMMTADYWIAKMDDPDAVIMTPEQIEALNRYNAEEYPGYIDDWRAYEEPVSGNRVKNELIADTLPTGEGDTYLDGEAATPEFWHEVEVNIDVDGVPELVQVGYGVAVCRSNLRVWPVAARVTSDPEGTDDSVQNSGVLMGEHLAVFHTSADGQWLYVHAEYCRGWIEAEDVALCASFEEWAAFIEPGDYLTCTGDRFVLDANRTDPELSFIPVYMGTKLLIVPPDLVDPMVDKRVPYANFCVFIPRRRDDGRLMLKQVLLPASRQVYRGPVPYTAANVLRLAFAMQGDLYGWGGMNDMRDCSEYVLELYRCFGIRFSRNSSAQARMAFNATVFSGVASEEEKDDVLDDVRPGSLLEFSGHIMVYLGKEGSTHYAISALGSVVPEGSEEVVVTYSVMVNSLNVTRRNGKTWTANLKHAVQVEPEPAAWDDVMR